MKLAQSPDSTRGGVGTQAALHNLRHGIPPPQSGKENPHYFDDGALPRAVPIGVFCAGDPEKAAQLAGIDASVTNSEDGVWAAQAMAVAVSLVCSGEHITAAINAAREYLPASSWIKRIVDEAFSIAGKTDSVNAVFPKLHDAIVNREYSYGNVAPETVALVFVIAHVHGNSFHTAVSTSTGFAKSGETLPAMVGALSGAMNTTPITSESWLQAVEVLHGICIPSFAGKNYIALTERIANVAGQKISS
jgi:ADP-ribosylglycohydrolase